MSRIDFDLERIDRMVGEARIANDPAEADAIRHATIVELLGAILLQLGEISDKLDLTAAIGTTSGNGVKAERLKKVPRKRPPKKKTAKT